MIVGIGELARELRRDPKAIRRAVEAGHITRRPDGQFDLEQAIEEWNANVLHNRGHNNRNPQVVEMRRQGNDEPQSDGEIPERPTKGSEYSRARAATQIYEARLKKLRYEERAKHLAPVHEIATARFQEMRIIRDACLNIPARISAQLAAETSEHRVYEILENEILAAFSAYADGKLDEEQSA